MSRFIVQTEIEVIARTIEDAKTKVTRGDFKSFIGINTISARARAD